MDNINSDWIGDVLSDSGGLRGEIGTRKDGQITIRWRYNFRLGNKQAKIDCGTYPNKSMADIRSDRDKARELVAQGLDPRAKKVADKIERQTHIAETIAKAELEKKQTFKDMFDDWLLTVKRGDNNKGIIQSFNKHLLPSLGNISIKQLTDRDLLNVYRSISDKGTQRTAELLFNDTKQMFKWAELRQPWRSLLIEGNPARLVSKKDFLSNYSRERDRVLSQEELVKLKQAFKSVSEKYNAAENKYETERPLKLESQIALWICLSTACRIGELLKSEWKHVDLEQGTWLIPAENSKKVGGRQTNHTVYLSEFALNQFKQLHALHGESKWLFPATNKENTHVCVKSVSKQVGDRQTLFKNRNKTLISRINSNSLVVGDREWTPHDLRRTAATMMQELKISLDVIDRCQHHTLEGKVRRHYMHHEYKEEMKEAWHLLGVELTKILGT